MQSNDKLSQAMQSVGDEISRTLDHLIEPVSGVRGRVIEAMRYASLGGGKRLRPFLLVSTADLFNVPRHSSLRAGAAVEMIHCYSLIHDDLPTMDDSDVRRGRPSVHKKFDDATAILAGDGLLTQAFEVLANPKTAEDADIRLQLIARLAAAAGAAGMVGGQMIDIFPKQEQLDLEGISELQRLKTGALIKFSCLGGAILGRAQADATSALTNYAANLGLAFQIVDDLLDAEGTEEEMGKPTGQDADLNKATFVKLLGHKGARTKAETLVKDACEQLTLFGPKAERLGEVPRFVINRRW